MGTLYTISTRGLLDGLEDFEQDTKLIQEGLDNNNPDFDQVERTMDQYNLEKTNVKNNDWVLHKAYGLAEKYGLNEIGICQQKKV